MVLYVGKCQNGLLPSGRHVLCWASINVGESSLLFDLLLDEGVKFGTNVIHNFGVF